MDDLTTTMWAKQNRHPGDRERLFAAVGGSWQPRSVLYPGSYVDIAASFVFDDVTYVDSDKRAAKFFADRSGVNEIISRHRTATAATEWSFVGGDYGSDLGLDIASFDLLVSLYAGFVSDACTRYLVPGGRLLVNSSHGDVALAALNPAYRLEAVVNSRAGRYTVATKDLGTYLVPKKSGQPISRKSVMASGRGIAYTRSPFAYVFRLHGHHP